MHTRAIQTLLTGLILMIASVSLAQQKHVISWNSPNGASQYTLDHRIEVADLPGHILRVAEIVWDINQAEPIPSFNGVSVVSATTTVMTDYQNFNGLAVGYMILNLETGDQIYLNSQGATTTSFLEDGTLNSSSFSGLLTITGGTGAFTGIRGLLRQGANWNLATDASKVEPTTFEGEYWFVNAME